MDIKLTIAVLLSLIGINAYGAVDPVAWSLNPTTGFSKVTLNEETLVTYTLTVNAKMPGPVTLHTRFKKIGGTFTMIDECNNVTVKPNRSCKVTIHFRATQTKPSSIQMIYQYHNNVIPLPVLKTTVTTNKADVVGFLTNLPAQFTLSNPEQQPIFKVTYTNIGTTNVTGYAGNAAGTNLLTAIPEKVATVAILAGENSCGSSNNPITLNPGHSCSISGQLTPHALGKLTVSGLFTYNNKQTVIKTGNTEVVQGTGPCQLSAVASLPFLNSTYQYADNVLQFKFTNHCRTPVTLGTVTYTSSNMAAATITPGEQFDKCSGQTLAANRSCTVLVSVIAEAAGPLSISAHVTADGHTASATSATSVQAPGYKHKVTFINQCPFRVWYGVAQPPGSVDPTPNPTPLAYLLEAQVEEQAPATKSITMIGSYNGQFFPRTGCSLVGGSKFRCASGDCDSAANGQCLGGNVFEPYTRIEETFSASSQGVYDISLINGASIPAELKGLGPFTSQMSSPAAPYVCTGAGAPIQPPFPQFSPSFPPPPPPLPPAPPTSPLGNCTWEYLPPGLSPLFNFVSNTTTVTDCNSCAAPNHCGLAFQTTPTAGDVVLACGKLLGYWTINQLCSADVIYHGNSTFDPRNVFHCKSPITDYSTQSYPAGTNAYSLYACVPNGSALDSCYNSGALTTCCGAKDWNMAPYITWQTQQAFSSNPDWVSGNSGGASTLSPTPLESIQWLKEACPTAYSYPYDDHASTFNCDYSDPNQENKVKMDFEVIFCPGGIVGDLSVNP